MFPAGGLSLAIEVASNPLLAGADGLSPSWRIRTSSTSTASLPVSCFVWTWRITAWLPRLQS